MIMKKKYGRCVETIGICYFQETTKKFAPHKREAKEEKRRYITIYWVPMKNHFEVWYVGYLFRNAIGINICRRERKGWIVLEERLSSNADPQKTLVHIVERLGARMAIQNSPKLNQDARSFNSSINHVLLWFATKRDLALDEVTF